MAVSCCLFGRDLCTSLATVLYFLPWYATSSYLGIIIKITASGIIQMPFHFNEHLGKCSDILNKKFFILCILLRIFFCCICCKVYRITVFPKSSIDNPTSIKQHSSPHSQHMKLLLLFVFNWVNGFLVFDFGAAWHLTQYNAWLVREKK